MFREDLFYRLNVITIHIPPLRERREEILVFLEYFLRKYSEFYGKQPAPFGDYAIGRMMEYTWPGNIRELENLVKRYVIVGNEAQIIRELSTHKPIVSSMTGSEPFLGLEGQQVRRRPDRQRATSLDCHSQSMLAKARRRTPTSHRCWRLADGPPCRPNAKRSSGC